MVDAAELMEQNRVLRERVEALERAAAGSVDFTLSALVANVPDFVSVVTPEGRFLATGRTSSGFGSVLGRSVYEFADPPNAKIMRDAHVRACETRQPVVYEVVSFGEGGEPDHSYLARAVPILDGDEVKGVVIVATDITERVRLQRSLEENERTMRMALEATRMGLWRWDALADEVQWDARMLEIFGVAQGPKTAADYLDLVAAEDRPRVGQAIERAMQEGVYPGFEYRVASAEGTPERFVMCVGSVTHDATGRAVGLIGGVLDITEHKRMARQLQRAERVEALGQLTAGITHNFNNLLAAILPNIETALPSLPPEERGGLTAALEASLQARELIKDLMEFSTRRVPVPRGACDVRDVVTRIESVCRATFPREIEFAATVASDVGAVALPATDLEQVLLNLLFNARDAVLESATVPRRIEVRVDVQRTAPPDVQRTAPQLPQVRLGVSDTGIGMSEAVRARVFEPFFTTKPAHRGSGLGLANALARVTDASGTLECQSEPGIGTTFTLRLPCAAPLAADVAGAVSVHGQAGCGGETVLVVDDETLVRSAASRVLRAEGYVTLQASSAAEARAVLAEHGDRVQLVLLDVSMPTESGVHALPSLRERCSAPVILFTGWGTAVPEGAAAVLHKPASRAELCCAVRQVLDAQRAAQREGAAAQAQ